jgi:prepilin-type N-terminal cleavage/methylation domain-containing protein
MKPSPKELTAKKRRARSDAKKIVDPQTDADWMDAVDMAHAALSLDAARQFGLVAGGPMVNVERCVWIVEKGKAMGFVPRADAIERFIVQLRATSRPSRLPGKSSRDGFTFIEVLFAVIILGIGLVMLAGMFSTGMIGTGAVMTDSRINEVLADAHDTIDTQAASLGTSALLPGQVNSKFMPIVIPLPPSFASRLGDQVLPSDNRYGYTAFYRRDSINNAFAQIFVIALRNENFPLYSKAIPIPPSLYGAPPPAMPSIAGTLAFDQKSGTSTIAFASTVSNAAQGAFVLIADDGTNPQTETWTDDKGVIHTSIIYNNAPMTGRFLRLASQLPTDNLHLSFSLEPGHDLTASDWASLNADGNTSGVVLTWLIGRAPMPNAAMGDFSGPFGGANQDVGANSSFTAVNRANN